MTTTPDTKPLSPLGEAFSGLAMLFAYPWLRPLIEAATAEERSRCLAVAVQQRDLCARGDHRWPVGAGLSVAEAIYDGIAAPPTPGGAPAWRAMPPSTRAALDRVRDALTQTHDRPRSPGELLEMAGVQSEDLRALLAQPRPADEALRCALRLAVMVVELVELLGTPGAATATAPAAFAEAVIYQAEARSTEQPRADDPAATPTAPLVVPPRLNLDGFELIEHDASTGEPLTFDMTTYVLAAQLLNDVCDTVPGATYLHQGEAKPGHRWAAVTDADGEIIAWRGNALIAVGENNDDAITRLRALLEGAS